MVGIAVAPFLRAAVSQQAELAALEQEVADREQKVAELESQLARWDDPAFVKAQARQRLRYVMPGEVGYIVLDEEQAEEASVQDDPAAEAALEVSGSDSPWFGTLWESVRQAAEPEPDSSTARTVTSDEPVPAPVP